MTMQSTIHTNEVDNTGRNQLLIGKLAAIAVAVALLAAAFNAGAIASTPSVVNEDPTSAVVPAAGSPYWYSSPGSSLDTENSFSW